MKKETISEGVIKYSAPKPGPTLAIFAGVHGNERAGILALEELISSLQIKAGVLYAVFANPPAIKENARFITKNINRCFQSDNQGTEYEDKRARELMIILDKCDALLDLHAFDNTDGEPFIICEDESLQVASIFDPDIISTGWNKAEPGSADGYMFENGKIGICLENGQIKQSEKYKELAVKSSLQFLKYFGMIDSDVEFSKNKKLHLKVKYAVIKTSEKFKMEKGFKNFQKLQEGQLLAIDDNSEYLAKDDEYIIFPKPDAPLGHEVFLIAASDGDDILGQDE